MQGARAKSFPVLEEIMSLDILTILRLFDHFLWKIEYFVNFSSDLFEVCVARSKSSRHLLATPLAVKLLALF